jgi:arylsulfatase A-like enzyme
VILILMDDMGWRDLGCYGSSFYETPNIDRLASEGMRFTDAYAACPVCSPTRASIMTGKYPARVGVTDYIGGFAQGKLLAAPYVDHLPLEEVSLAEALKAAGYQTWHLGKWHLGNEPYWPEKQGFDVNVGGCQYGSPKTYFSPYKIPTLSDGPEGEYLSDRLTNEAIALIRKSDKSRPFFMNFWHYAVHIPIEAPEELVEKYRVKARRLGVDKNALEVGEHFPSLNKRAERVVRRRVQGDPVYAAMIENLDRNVGRLLDAVKESGREGETIVMFTSDNGGVSTSEGSPTCNSPLVEGKGWMYDGGVRVPLIVKWPGKARAGSVCHVPVTSPDFYPTVLEAVGQPKMPKQHVDGESFAPLLRETGSLSRDCIYWHYPHYGNQGGTPGCSVRCGNWKLIEFFEDGRLELYNLKEDISEAKNRVKDEPEVARRLHEKLVAWRTSVGGKMPEKNSKWTEAQ